jgi:hypothetical protein
MNLQRVRFGIRYPDRIVAHINTLIQERFYDSEYNSEGIDVFEEDWDNLIILDACRYDAFEKLHSIDGELKSKTSRGSMSREFARGNFSDKSLTDTVYVSANFCFPEMYEELNTELHEFIPVHYDMPDLPTARPESVTEEALHANERFPNKRLIVHYMQPHWPYIGASAERIEQPDDHHGMHSTIKSNGLSRRDVLSLYKENVELVLSEARQLVNAFSGKTVITADHGELLGERQRPIPVRNYGHPSGVYVDELVTVPWHICNYEERKSIVSERSKNGGMRVAPETIKENLKAMGYI